MATAHPRRQWIVVDCGVTFGDETRSPGVDLIMPDIRYLAERREDVLGIVPPMRMKTISAPSPYLWPMLEMPRSMPRRSPPD